MADLSPNSTPGLKNPSLIVLHYTASPTLESARSWLCNPAARASAHYIIGRGGACVQLVSTNRIAWHAGRSVYKGVEGVNKISIGVELVSLGPLVWRRGQGVISVVSGDPVSEADVFEGFHPSTPGRGAGFWQKYTEPQLARLDTLLTELFAKFPSLQEVVGHCDVSPGRKLDPWPLDVPKINAKFARIPTST